MDRLKYVGKSFSPMLLSLSGKPFDNEAFQIFEIETFKELFRKQIITIMRSGSGLFRDSVYKNLSPQFDAFEQLLLVFKQRKCEILEITNDSHDPDEFLARVRVRIQISSPLNEGLFAKSIAPNSNSYVLVSFYTGLCKEFTALSKENELLENALQGYDSPGFLAAWSKSPIVDGKLNELPVKENEFDDKAFDPELVIQEILSDMRLEQRFNYTVSDKKFKTQRFYHSPEGFIFRIEIDGYVTVPVNNGE